VADLSRQEILARLETSLLGRNLIYSLELPSTNDEARRLAEAGAPEGTVVVADHQTAGRGRQGRRWVAPPGSSLLFSIVFRPLLAPQRLQRLTMITGLAILDALSEQTGIRPALKWPNDIVLKGEKMGGILAELQLSGDRADHAIVGIGLNINLDPKDLPDRLLVPATSVSCVLGRPVSRATLLVAILHAIEIRYLALLDGRVPQREWAHH
jgi:BirA family biotin operon repressor/biotin-[acetyl-CoA-carboxylase] ligase